MKHVRIFSKMVVLGLFCTFFAACEKVGIQKEEHLLYNHAEAENQSVQLKSACLPYSLENVITTINSMVKNGVLSKGEGQSLIAKVENAIKSIEKANANAASGQLGAFIKKVESLVDKGSLTSEQGQSLIKPAEFAINFPQRNFIDKRDGRKYSVVPIGDQIWMAENLQATKFLNGDAIPFVTDNLTWSTSTTAASCNYNNDQATANIYGKLYNFYAVVDPRKICPAGWHVPSDAEWTTLTTFLGGESVSGGQLKETGTSHWLSPNTSAANATGFTALPGGYRYLVGDFYSIGITGYWWSSSENSSTYGWYRYMGSDYSNVHRYSYFKLDGFSVRCLRD